MGWLFGRERRPGAAVASDVLRARAGTGIGDAGRGRRAHDRFLAPAAPAGFSVRGLAQANLVAPSAFTLIELLVVIAIIAILVTLLLSIIGPINAARDQTSSISRMRQWGAALGAYVADNNGLLPRRGQGVQAVQQLTRPTGLASMRCRHISACRVTGN